MKIVLSLTRRNLRLFFRDPAAVFFSLLSALILIGLYALFLGQLQVDNLAERFPQASDADIRGFVNSWVFAGITMITTVTTGLAALSTFVDDRASGRFRDFLVAPIGRVRLTIGYLLSSFLIALLMSMIVLIVGQGYQLIQGQPMLSGDQLLRTVGAVALSAAAFSAVSAVVVTFISSSGAFSALSTVVGTVIGFLAGAYIPPGTLPSTVVTVMNSLPFAHAAMLIRQPLTENAVDAITGGNAIAAEALDTSYGVTLEFGSLDVTPGLAILVLAVVVVVFATVATIRIGRRIR